MGVSFQKYYLKVRLGDTSFERSLYPPHFGKKVLTNYHPYVQGTPKFKNIEISKTIALHLKPTSEGYQFCLQNYSHQTLQEK